MSEPVTVRAIAAEVVKHLPGWTLVPEKEDQRGQEWADNFADLRHESGAEIGFSQERGTRPPKLAINCDFPGGVNGIQQYRPREGTFRIGIAMGKHPEQIAKDIERRLLPQYLSAYAEAVATKTKDEAARSDAKGLLKELAAILGYEYLGDNERYSHLEWKVWSRSQWEPRVELEMSRYGSLDVKIHTGNPETMRRLARLLAEVQKPESE